jgi:hypothetical protein
MIAMDQRGPVGLFDVAIQFGAAEMFPPVKHVWRKAAVPQGEAAHIEQPLIAEKIGPGLGPGVRLAQRADQGIPLKAIAIRRLAMQRSQQVRGMLLRRRLQPPAGLDIVHDKQAGLGMENTGDGHGAGARQVFQHIAFDIQRPVGARGLGDHLASGRRTHQPDIADTAARQRTCVGNRRARRLGDGLARSRGHVARPASFRSQARAPSSIMSSADSNPSGPP